MGEPEWLEDSEQPWGRKLPLEEAVSAHSVQAEASCTSEVPPTLLGASPALETSGVALDVASPVQNRCMVSVSATSALCIFSTVVVDSHTFAWSHLEGLLASLDHTFKHVIQ